MTFCNYWEFFCKESHQPTYRREMQESSASDNEIPVVEVLRDAEIIQIVMNPEIPKEMDEGEEIEKKE